MTRIELPQNFLKPTYRIAQESFLTNMSHQTSTDADALTPPAEDATPTPVRQKKTKKRGKGKEAEAPDLPEKDESGEGSSSPQPKDSKPKKGKGKTGKKKSPLRNDATASSGMPENDNPNADVELAPTEESPAETQPKDHGDAIAAIEEVTAGPSDEGANEGAVAPEPDVKENPVKDAEEPQKDEEEKEDVHQEKEDVHEEEPQNEGAEPPKKAGRGKGKGKGRANGGKDEEVEGAKAPKKRTRKTKKKAEAEEEEAGQRSLAEDQKAADENPPPDVDAMGGSSIEQLPPAPERSSEQDGAQEQPSSEPATEPSVESEEPTLDYTVLDGLLVNKLGNVVTEDGKPVGRVVKGGLRKLLGKKVDAEGKIWDNGKVIGQAEPLPEEEASDDSGPFEEFPGSIVGKDGLVRYNDDTVVGRLVSGEAKALAGKTVDADGDITDKHGNVKGHAERYEVPDEAAEEQPSEPPKVDFSIIANLPVNKLGNIIGTDGRLLAKVVEGNLSKLVNRKASSNGEIFGDNGKVIGRVELVPEDEREKFAAAPFSDFPDAYIEKDGSVKSEDGTVIGRVTEGDPKKLRKMRIDPDGDILAKDGSVVGKAVRVEEEEEKEEEEVDRSLLEGKTVTKLGYVLGDDGVVYGKLVSGDAENLAGKKVDRRGQIWDPFGNVIGQAELLPGDQRKKMAESPFEDYPDAKVEKDGTVTTGTGQIVGKLTTGDAGELAGRHVDASGDILDKAGKVLGSAIRWEPPAAEEVTEAPVDRSVLAGKRVNKLGYVTDTAGTIFGEVTDGPLDELIGKACDGSGQIFNDTGKVIGHAEVVPEGERRAKAASPFAGYEGLKVREDGMVVDSSGTVVGKLVEGDAVKLRNRSVDADGDILSPEGNVEGHAERYDEPTEAPEEEKAGPLAGLKVTREGKVFDDDGQHVGTLTSGDPKRCAGKTVDDEGDVFDKKGQLLGHVDLLADIPEPEPEPEPEKEDVQEVGPMPTPEPQNEEATPEPAEERKSLLDGCTVMADGSAYSSQGQLVGRLTDGKASECAGHRVNEHGVVLDSSGNPVGHVTLLSEIPTEAPSEEPMEPFEEPQEEEPTESPEEIEKREKLERDRKLAIRMSGVVQNSLDKLRPILRQITSHLENARQIPPEELDESLLVKTVKPLLEKGGSILDETLHEIRDMDPTGEAQNNARNPIDRDPLPEEQHLARLLSELTKDVTETLDHAKTAISGMPHAKEELTPALGLLSGPLGKILGAVGLLLSGVLELLGSLLALALERYLVASLVGLLQQSMGSSRVLLRAWVAFLDEIATDVSVPYFGYLGGAEFVDIQCINTYSKPLVAECGFISLLVSFSAIRIPVSGDTDNPRSQVPLSWPTSFPKEL